MYISYNKEKTDFRKICRNVISSNRDKVKAGDQIEIDLHKEGGYPGDMSVKIEEGDEFWSDYEGSDVTRFPARIKGCATALKDLEMFGKYRIKHDDGIIELKKT